MTPALEKEFSEALGREVRGISFIQENAYCSIHLAAECGGERAVIKKYKGDDPRLASLEAKGVDFYHGLVAGRDAYLDSRTLGFSAERNVVAVSFVPGMSFADFLYQVRGDAGRRAQAVEWMRQLARLLRLMEERTRKPGAATDPFLEEYFGYCTRRLVSLPLVGALAFRGDEANAGEILKNFHAARPVPSFIHGDFVFRNMHVEGGRIGLIDFANTNDASHALNDACNLRIGLGNTLVSGGLKRALWEAFEEEFEPGRYHGAIQRFYFEYHRRRWLMLNWRTRDPRRWARALRGMASFARPWGGEGGGR